MMMVVARVLNRIGGLVLQSPRELHDGIFRGGHPRGKGSLSRRITQENTLPLHNYLSKNRNPRFEIREPLCSSHNRALLLCQQTTKRGGGEGKFGNSIFQRSKNLVIFIKLYRNIDGRIATFL